MMTINAARPMLLIVLIIILFGCSSGGGGDGTPITPAKIDKTQLPGTYTADNITTTLTNCSDSNNNGTFVFDTAELVVAGTGGSDFTATMTLIKDDSGTELKSVLTIQGTIDDAGNISGSFQAAFSIGGVADTTGNGTFTGNFTGDAVTFNYSDQDQTGDTCESTGDITLTGGSQNSGGVGNGGGGGVNPPTTGLQITGSDTSTIGTNVQFASGFYQSTGQTFEYSWNMTEASPLKITNFFIRDTDLVVDGITSILFGILGQNGNYTYTVSCTMGTATSGDCSGVTIDDQAHTVTLNNVFLFVAPNVTDNNASSGITVSGVLSYQIL